MLPDVFFDQLRRSVFAVGLNRDEGANGRKTKAISRVHLGVEKASGTTAHESREDVLSREDGLEETSMAASPADCLGETHEQAQGILACAIVGCHRQPVDVDRDSEPNVHNTDQITLGTHGDKFLLIGLPDLVPEKSSDVVNGPADALAERLEAATAA